MAEEDGGLRIADVLKTGDKLGAGAAGIREYRVPGARVCALFLPVEPQGGDMYAIYHLRGGRAGVFVGDVSGHDFSSAIVAAEVMKYVESNRDRMREPGAFLTMMCSDLHARLSSYQRHITAGVFVIDPGADSLLISTAGHPHSLVFDAQGRAPRTAGARAFPIGFEKKVSYGTCAERFAKGDVLVTFTDGVVSGKDAGGGEFGTAPLESSFASARGDVRRALGEIEKRLKAFAPTEGTKDDRTILCVERC
ncbi:MAG: PP2C family protein-serine/threonine phosphatase [bacterium]